jgi:oxalate---CoA ligase
MVTDAGLTRNDVVTVVMPDGPALLSTILGVASVAICAPFNPALRNAEMESYLRDLSASALIIDRTVDLQVREIACRLGMAVLDFERSLGVSGPASQAGQAQASDTALVLQTSATTGKPRLVPLTHSNLRAMAANTLRILHLTREDRFLSIMPLFHLTGLLSSLAQLLAGGSVISTSGFDSSRFLNWLEQFHPTWYTAAPALHNAIVPLVEKRPDVLDRFPLRFARSIGAPLPQSLLADLERTLRVPVLEGYGMTEAGMVASNAPPPLKRKPGSVGQSAGPEVAIMGDAESFLPAGCEGEIAVRGPAVIQGYRNAEADESVFRGGWFLTGDIGHLDEEGFLFVTGRTKDIINRGGEKVLPVEIDEVLSGHPSVSEAVAFGVPHPTLGEDVAAAVVLVPGASVTSVGLRRFVAARLADFKVPRRIVFLDAIPKGPTGKALRTKLAEQFQIEESLREGTARKPKEAALADLYRDPAPVEATDAPRPLEAAETRLAAIWRHVLGIPYVGVDDDFFALGGDSLSAALMLVELQEELKSDQDLFNAVEFFDHPTVASLARLVVASGAQWYDSCELEGRRKSPEALVLAIQKQGSRIPLFCFPASSIDPFYLRHLSKGLGNSQPFYAVRHPQPLRDNRLLKIEDLARISIAAIRSVAPNGPYVIAGHCFGGVIAFETARQLLSQGGKVTHLLLFDVPAPGYPKIGRSWRKYLKESRRIAAAWVRGKRAVGVREALEHVNRLRDIVTRRFTGRTSRALASVGSDYLTADRELKELNGMALWEYVPKEFLAPMLLFIAADELISTQVLDDARFGWRDFARGGLELRTVRGDHNSIFSASHAPALAAELELLLRPSGIALT